MNTRTEYYPTGTGEPFYRVTDQDFWEPPTIRGLKKMTKITLKLAVNRLPVVRNDEVEFESIADAMLYVDRAELLSHQLRIDAVSLRKAIREALDEEPEAKFG